MTSLTAGDPVPWFILPSSSNPTYHFDTVGGYRVILFFLGSTKLPGVAEAIQDFCAMQSQLAASEIVFFGIDTDPDDQALNDRVTELTFCKFLWDFDYEVSQQYGLCEANGAAYQPTAFVLDQTLRVLKVFPLQQADGYAAEVLAYARRQPQFGPAEFANRQAPVLFIPRVLDRAFCRSLIELHQSSSTRDSGFMREVNGKTVEILDANFKKRRDINLADTPLREPLNQIVLRRVAPEIEKVFQFKITRFERHIVACYDAANQGFFNRHRDNTTKGTAHRRFAMTLNLNTDEYEGGCLRFPEFGSQLYRPEVGEAVVFSCSLLHEVTPVTQGQRYALLSFFYGEDDAVVRERNRKYLADQPDSSDQPAAVESKRQQSTVSASKTTSKATKTTGFQPKSGQSKSSKKRH